MAARRSNLRPRSTSSHRSTVAACGVLADEKEGWLQREFKDGLTWLSLVVQADTFQQDPRKVLSSSLTEDFGRWLEALPSPDWCDRYGGRWTHVQQLVGASRDAEAKRVRQLEVAEVGSVFRQVRIRRARERNLIGVFLSHKKEDFKAANQIREVLRIQSAGHIEVFMSENITKGDDWQGKIEQALYDSDWLILLYSGVDDDGGATTEAGIFRGMVYPDADRLVVLYPPNVELPYSLKKYRAVKCQAPQPGQPDELDLFFKEFFGKPPYPGLPAINPVFANEARATRQDAAEKIVPAFGLLVVDWIVPENVMFLQVLDVNTMGRAGHRATKQVPGWRPHLARLKRHAFVRGRRHRFFMARVPGVARPRSSPKPRRDILARGSPGLRQVSDQRPRRGDLHGLPVAGGRTPLSAGHQSRRHNWRQQCDLLDQLRANRRRHPEQRSGEERRQDLHGAEPLAPLSLGDHRPLQARGSAPGFYRSPGADARARRGWWRTQ